MNNKTALLEITDSDIATVEVLHDQLLEHGHKLEDMPMAHARELTRRMYAAFEPVTWEEKSDWLRDNGYHLVIEETGGGGMDEQDLGRWVASIGGEGARYAETIGEAVSLVYEWVSIS